MPLVYDNGTLIGWTDDECSIRPGSRERLEFLAEHPEWSIRFVKSFGYFQAVRDEPNTIITDYDLPALLTRARAAC